MNPQNDSNVDDQNKDGLPTELENLLDELPREGDAIDALDNLGKQGDDNPADPSSEKNDGKNDPNSGDQKNKTDDDNLPFHKHPRWKRQVRENKELKAQLEDANKKLDQLINAGHADNTQSPTSPAPEWFKKLYGNDPKHWAEYSKYSNQEKQQFIDDVLKQVDNKLRSVGQQTDEEKEQIKQYLQENFEALEDEGLEFDRRELLEIMNKYKPTDGKGNYDFHAGYDLLQKLKGANQNADKTKQVEKDNARKEAAAKVTPNSGGGNPQKPKVDLNMIRSMDMMELADEA